ncbi:MAG: OsmC family protein [Candidatus Hodarchaeales archaeon]|jgi:uncharacterized OsmC-like protein
MGIKEKETHGFTLTMEKTGPMQFITTFDKEQFPELAFDEPENAGGEDNYPNASRVLTAAVMNCLSASLTFCLTKSKLDLKGMKATGKATIGRNEEGYWRVQKIEVELEPLVKGDRKRIERCVDVFKKYCIVSMSVQAGITMETTVKIPD